MNDPNGPPLMGYYWNEAECNPQFNRGLLTIIAHDLDGHPHVLGTGFIVGRSDRNAVCVTAAHVFSGVRQLQIRSQRHSPSALPEFLPPPKQVDLDRKSLRVVSFENGRVESTVIEGLAFDEASDFAVFYISLQNEESEAFFSHQFQADGTPPGVGELVAILSYGDLKIDDYERSSTDAFRFSLLRRPVLRVGRVLASYLEGHRLCGGPCIETSIPVYSGMSGGPVMHFGLEGEAMRPFGFVCSDPDLDDENKKNRKIEGHSIVGILPCKNDVDAGGNKISKITIPHTDASGIFRFS